MEKPKVIMGCDHGGYKLKEVLKPYLEKLGYDVEDIGTNSEESVDYSDYAIKVAKLVGKGVNEKNGIPDYPSVVGVLVCRSAAGVVIAANKGKGIRAVATFDETSAEHSREHNAANVLGLSGDWTSPEKAKKILKKWLETPFSQEERHARRLKKISDFEK
jgi:ribose 5-phosphate isomerase B